MNPVFVKDFSQAELEDWVAQQGERPFRGRQLFRGMYVRDVRSWDECTDLGKSFRNFLETSAKLDALTLALKKTTPDGTAKYLFQLEDGHAVETVLIPDPPRNTLCVSSQVGCALRCDFCLTGTLGFKRNLTAAEIVDQVCQVRRDLTAEESRVTNIVFMGMGEPLANYDAVLRAIRIMTDPAGLAFSHRRITLSTAGVVPRIRDLGKDSPVNLAISLHAADDALRSRLMPVNRAHPLEELMRACREYPLPPRKRITFEYILLDGVNDDPAQAKKLVRLLSGVRAKVNLIPYNPHPGSPYRRPPEERVLAFQDVLTRARLTATIRQSRGAEIGAACGQLAAGYGPRKAEEGTAPEESRRSAPPRKTGAHP
jgi:23S rRNA (adenine2503-C2)-methyltransferase